MDICVYYNDDYIVDITPRELDPRTRSRVEELWSQPIPRKILIHLSQGETRMSAIQAKIGHSASTLHEAVQRLVTANLISYEMSYKGRKHKVLTTRVLCVTKNPKSKARLQKFFQGLWVDSEKTKRILLAIESDKNKWWTPEELSVKTDIAVDEIGLLLSNFDSQTTRALSHFLKKPPFEKKTSYRSHR